MCSSATLLTTQCAYYAVHLASTVHCTCEGCLLTMVSPRCLVPLCDLLLLLQLLNARNKVALQSGESAWPRSFITNTYFYAQLSAHGNGYRCSHFT
jgi:hypothetical protein